MSKRTTQEYFIGIILFICVSVMSISFVIFQPTKAWGG
jgi:hypothetical protein